MPSDTRSLLRAAANERAKSSSSGISDPFASYSSTGGLRCSACNFLGIKHESLWGAHALSKSHRANVARMRDEELRQAELQRTKDGKRKADESEMSPSQDDASLPTSRAAADTSETIDDGPEIKKARIDPEWELFKSQMETSADEDEPSRQGYSAGSALEAEAQLISHDANDGPRAGQDDELELKSAEELAAEERARKEQEEREEILSRLEEEQRQQDEADQR